MRCQCQCTKEKETQVAFMRTCVVSPPSAVTDKRQTTGSRERGNETASCAKTDFIFGRFFPFVYHLKVPQTTYFFATYPHPKDLIPISTKRISFFRLTILIDEQTHARKTTYRRKETNEQTQGHTDRANDRQTDERIN